MCLCVPVSPFTSRMSPSRPSVSSVLHFHQSVPFSCLSVTPSHFSSQPLFHISQVNYHVANFVFHPLPKRLWHSLSLHCTEAVPTQQFYTQQSNATPRPSTPSSGCLPQFPTKEVTAPFIQFFVIIHIQIVAL